MPGRGPDRGGRSGGVGVPKTDEHRRKIAEAVRRYWSSERGVDERKMRIEVAREVRRRRAAGGA